MKLIFILATALLLSAREMELSVVTLNTINGACVEYGELSRVQYDEFDATYRVLCGDFTQLTFNKAGERIAER